MFYTGIFYRLASVAKHLPYWYGTYHPSNLCYGNATYRHDRYLPWYHHA